MMITGAVAAAVSAIAFIGFLALNIAQFRHFRASFYRALLGPAVDAEQDFAPTGESNVIPLRAASPVTRPALRLAA